MRERVYWVKGAYDIDTHKSRAGVRTIAIPKMLAAPLERHLEAQVGDAPSSLVFTTATGGNIRTTDHQTLRRANGRVGSGAQHCPRDEESLHSTRYVSRAAVVVND